MAEFRTIHTAAGLIALASAEASGTPINLTHMVTAGCDLRAPEQHTLEGTV